MVIISLKGEKCAFLSVREKKFWVFDISTASRFLVCTGHFRSQGFFRGYRDDALEKQHPIADTYKIPTLTCAAISDDFLAIGCQDGIMTFFLNEDIAGRWVTTNDIPNGRVLKMSFSADGQTLAAVVAQGNERVRTLKHRALVFPTSGFPRIEVRAAPMAAPHEPIRLPKLHSTPKGIAVSADGTKIAIHTSRSGHSAKLQVFQKAESGWDSFADPIDIKIHPPGDGSEAHGEGITSMKIYK